MKISGIDTVCLIQPPFVQLNSPYPSIYYLRSFLEKQGYRVIVRDHSIALFESIFCRDGLAKIFSDVKKDREKILNRREKISCSRQYDNLTTRFLGDEDRWLSAIDRIVAFLRGQDHEWGHLLALANDVLPGGPSFDACLEEICSVKGQAGPDDSPLLATKLLADIAGFITQTLDEGFSLVRYVPSLSLNTGFREFSSVRKGMNGYIMRNFYRPLLAREWQKLSCEIPGRFLLGLTVPFPGCLGGALFCAASAKEYFENNVVTVAGGGYVNTELRFLEEEKFFDYFDYLSFDRGYGSLNAILEHENFNNPVLYKTIYRSNNGKIIRDNLMSDSSILQNIDDEAVCSVFPDYSGVDFSRYIYPVDDINPMHRLWSDGRWLKAYLAHGCYWHNCSFCDTGLDYIRCYKPVDPAALFGHLLQQAAVTGLHGVHLVDEACPPASLLRLALLNREAGLPLLFWGNIRFEKTFTTDMAAILAAGGVMGISAGIEAATESGLKRLEKGFDLQEAVSACAAFKEAGILVHVYCMYGLWNQDEQEIADSAETLRRFFAAGLVDSAFWHQFTLTKHSRLYAEKRSGLHSDLKPYGDRLSIDSGNDTKKQNKIFALNDLSFSGEEKFSRFSAPLDRLLFHWMHGDTSIPVSTELMAPSPLSCPVETLLDSYARKRDSSRKTLPLEKQAKTLHAIFLASKPLVYNTAAGEGLRWRWRFNECLLRLKPDQVKKTLSLLEDASSGTGIKVPELISRLENIFSGDIKSVWKKLRQNGLALY